MTQKTEGRWLSPQMISEVDMEDAAKKLGKQFMLVLGELNLNDRIAERVTRKLDEESRYSFIEPLEELYSKAPESMLDLAAIAILYSAAEKRDR